MRSSTIRLDSFSAATASERSQAGRNDLLAAFQRGHEQGLNDGRVVSLDALTAALAGLRSDMTAHDAVAAALRRETLSELLPVIAAIIDLLGTRSTKDRLRDALGDELRRIAEIAAPRRLVVRCAPSLRPDIENCLENASFAGALIEETHDDKPTVDLIVDKATITFDPNACIAALQAIIDDIMTED